MTDDIQMTDDEKKQLDLIASLHAAGYDEHQIEAALRAMSPQTHHPVDNYDSPYQFNQQVEVDLPPLHLDFGDYDEKAAFKMTRLRWRSSRAPTS